MLLSAQPVPQIFSLSFCRSSQSVHKLYKQDKGVIWLIKSTSNPSLEQHRLSLGNSDRHATAQQCQGKSSSQEAGYPVLKSNLALTPVRNQTFSMVWQIFLTGELPESCISLPWLSPAPVPAEVISCWGVSREEPAMSLAISSLTLVFLFGVKMS